MAAWSWRPIHLFARAKNKTPRRKGGSDQHVQVVKLVAKNNPKTREAAPAPCSRTRRLRSDPRAAWLRPDNKKARERVSPGLVGAALVNTLFWKILVTRVN